ncbi:hypothetical protein [Mameliella alba]|uniref:hypothetical protein n=1 Tax=Mameliella alba TaxID=561184 RepID=UPI000B53477D|nr:hypothetical protein [Mameliella alba]OWV44229.1 hypothetical protein CDZ95_05965 [Mameliella alba]
MSTLFIEDEEQALVELKKIEGSQQLEFDAIEFSDKFSLSVYLPVGFDSEMPAAYLESYHNQHKDLLRLLAYIENGSSDIKTLTADQQARHAYKVSVKGGSSQLSDNIVSVLAEALKSAAGKMTGEQVLYSIIGVALIAGCSWGWKAWLESRKEERLQEIQAQERRLAVESLTASSTQQVERLSEVMEKMASMGGAPAKALEAAEKINASYLKAASQTERSVIGEVEIDRDTAKELRAKPRRKSEPRRITKEMRVVDVNTADVSQSVITLEDLEDSTQSRVTFSDRLVDATQVDLVHEALRTRGTAVFRLEVREADDGEIRVESIVSVQEVPDDT